MPLTKVAPRASVSAAEPSPLTVGLGIFAWPEELLTVVAATSQLSSASAATTQQGSLVPPLGQELGAPFGLDLGLPPGFSSSNAAAPAPAQPATRPPGGSLAGDTGGGVSGAVGQPSAGDTGFNQAASPSADQATLEAMAGLPQPSGAPSGGVPQAPLSGSASAPSEPSGPTASQARALRSYAQLPLRFEANRGQVASSVGFLARGLGYNLQLTNSAEAILTLNRPPTAPPPVLPATGPAVLPPVSLTPPVQDVLRLRFVGASAAPRVFGQDELPERSNYFRGRTSWTTDIPNYARITYQDLYPGVDLVYYGNQGKLEYDLVVRPGASPSAVRLAFTGALPVSLDAQGGIVLRTAGGGTVVQHAPVMYQEIDGRRQTVTGRYQLQVGNQVTFQVDSYDPTRPLVVDPILNYSGYIGGSGNDYAYAVTTDSSGNTYFVGSTTSTNFNPPPDGFDTTLGGSQDAFVVKLSPTGQALFSTYLGGSGTEAAYGVAVDVSGSVFVTGETSSSNFPVTAGAFQPAYGDGGRDAFVVRLNGAGDLLQYASYYGFETKDHGSGIAVDVDGAAYVTGSLDTGGEPNAFALKVAPDGKLLLYNKVLSGTANDYGYGVAVDDRGYAVVVGQTASADFPGLSGSWDSALGGPADGFLARLDPQGNLLRATYLGGTSDEQASGVALDYLGNVYVTGWTDSSDFPTASPQQPASGGGYDAFLAKFLDSSDLLAAGPTYSTYYGGSANDYGYSVLADGATSATVAGLTYSTNLTQVNQIQAGYGGSGDAFVAQWNAAGSQLLLSSYLGGSGTDAGYGASWDADGNVFLTGYTNSTDFPYGGGGSGSPGGGADAFISKVGLVPLPPAVTTVSPDTGESSSDQVTSDQSPLLSGTAPPNSSVSVTRDGFGVVGTATADSSVNGNWALTQPSATLAPGDSTTIQVRLDANTEKSFAGPVTFTTNDPNLTTVQLPIIGTVGTPDTVQYRDDGSAGFATIGTWTTRHGAGVGKRLPLDQQWLG